jgi:heterotetrameric sarcosine oxidase gamma subunit
VAENLTRGEAVVRSWHPVARSAIVTPSPVEVRGGWEVSTRPSSAALQLSDRSALAKVAVRVAGGAADSLPGSPAVQVLSAQLGTRFGTAVRRGDGVLVVGSGPGEWLLLGAPGSAPALLAGLPGSALGVDLTHGRALVRLTGADSPRLLAKICAIDLRGRVRPDGSALRTTVAKVVTDLVRDDVDGVRSYLLHCERSSGQYFWDALIDSGAEFDVGVAGFADR